MKMIQTFWTGQRPNPALQSFGWLGPEYHLMSWSLSVHLLRQQYDEVVLHTDQAGKSLLIDQLKLPYTEVQVVLDELNRYDPDLWALAKIDTYARQTEPFLHIDGDVFIWQSFSEDLLASRLITQNLENGGKDYAAILTGLKGRLAFLPQVIKDDQNLSVYTYNAGIFGGHDLDFISRYCQQAFAFVDKNAAVLDTFHKTTFNIFFEQYLYYLLTVAEGAPVDCLFPGTFPDTHYLGFGSFEEVPVKRTYLHLVSKYKKNKQVLSMMERQLREEFPQAYLQLLGYFEATPGLQMPSGTTMAMFEKYLGQSKAEPQISLLQRDTAQFTSLKCFAIEGLELHWSSSLSVHEQLELAPRSNDQKSAYLSQHLDMAYTATIPLLSGEVSQTGIDELDHEILNFLNAAPKTISELLDHLFPFFENESKDNLSAGFKKLIAERLKNFLCNRIIDINIENQSFNINQQDFGTISHRIPEKNRASNRRRVLS